jgi:hypothetical protein
MVALGLSAGTPGVTTPRSLSDGVCRWSEAVALETRMLQAGFVVPATLEPDVLGVPARAKDAQKDACAFDHKALLSHHLHLCHRGLRLHYE